MISTKDYQWPRYKLKDYIAIGQAMSRIGKDAGNLLEELETEFSNWIGTRYGLAVCNGTSGIYTALFAVGVSPLDEVIVTSASFWASSLPVLHLGAIPVFADIDPNTGCLDPEQIRKKITPKTRAIIIVHLWGMPARMDEIINIARENKISVIEDASHAHGALYKNKKVGSIGDVGVFSFQTAKLLPVGDGGMLVTSNDRIYARAVAFARFEKLRESGGFYKIYLDTGMGLKFRMSALSAALGRSQLSQIDSWNEKMIRSCEYLSAALESLGVETFLPPVGIKRVYHKFAVRLPQERFAIPSKSFAQFLREDGIPAENLNSTPVHRTTLFQTPMWKNIARIPNDYPTQGLPVQLPNLEKQLLEVVVLPVFHSASRKKLDGVIRVFEKHLSDWRAATRYGVASKRFALIGCGNISLSHYQAIQQIDGELVATLDCVKQVKNPPEKYFPNCNRFLEAKDFFDWLKMENDSRTPIDFVSVCTPDFLHLSFAQKILESGSDVICEKPLVCHPEDLMLLGEAEKKTGHTVYGVMQSRWYPPLKNFQGHIKSYLKQNSISHAKVEWVAPRSESYERLWRGDPTKAAGLVMDIGIHSLDMMIWLFGSCLGFKITDALERSVRAEMYFKDITVEWFLSIGEKCEAQGSPENLFAKRRLVVGNHTLDFTKEFVSLHPMMFRDIISGRGLTIQDLTPSLVLAYGLQRKLEEMGHLNQNGHLFACAKSDNRSLFTGY